MRIGTRTRLSLLATMSAAVGAGALAAPAHAVTGPTVNFVLYGADANGDYSLQEGYHPGLTAPEPFLWSESFSAISMAGALAHVSTDCGQGAGPQPVTLTISTSVNGTMNCTFTGSGSWIVSVSATDSANNTTTVSHHVTVKAPVTPAPPQVVRYDGDTRYGTGVVLSQAAFPAPGSAGAVILARGDVFADALAGIPLAKAKNGPLLLTPGGTGAVGLDPNVEGELVRVLPKDKNHTVFILGGTAAIPQTVEDHINALGYSAVRLAGGSRFDTALAIATDPRALNTPKNAVVARGDDFADALAAGPFAANVYKDSNGTPAAIVLSTGTGPAASLPAGTADYLKARFAAGGQVMAIGGGAAAAAGTVPVAAGNFQKVVGQNRYDTAAQVAGDGWSVAMHPMSLPPVGIAVGTSFPDALTGGAYMALQDGPLLLTDNHQLNGDYLSQPVSAMLTGNPQAPSWSEVDAFGGPKVILPQHVTETLRWLNEDLTHYFEHHAAF
jgi:hypothetical protein